MVMEWKLNGKQRQDLIQRHRKERDGRVRDRIKAVLAFDDGYSYTEIARAARQGEPQAKSSSPRQR